MKNKYIKYTHISESKFKEFLKLFSADLDASKIAMLSNLNRNTVNFLLQKILARIREMAEQESYFDAGEIEVDESYFGAKRIKGRRGREAGGKAKVFGVKKRGDKVYTQIVKNCSASELVPIIKRLVPVESTIYSDEWKAYDGLVNAGYKHHYRVKHTSEEFANGRAHINGIENFWGIAKARLEKFRGIRHDKFNLYLKECEWRFNHRKDDLYMILLSEFRKNPL